MECASRSFSQPPAAIPMDATEVYLPGNRFEILGGEKYSDIQNNNNNNELSTKLGQFDVRCNGNGIVPWRESLSSV